ncbi:hypothetical protein [Caulobacter sp. BK020]|uniref:hypothetical protein n=1 Tax=Caulobacter sp. BK020 TaxID=2512117 RepID=UPI0010461072|nr:hypothetical protein [Caulobacter sp. BK020]TCS16784.1 hypothetical protein EV278_103290 [Caulobacter sp. BK020]
MSSHPLRQAARFLLGVPTDGINHTLGRMLALAQATPLCFVAVTGPDAGEAMSVLWRRGYDRVEAARRATCRAADEQSDVLLIVGCSTVPDARAAAASTMAMLRPGGALVIDAGAIIDQELRKTLCDDLRTLGLDVEPQAHLSAELLATRPSAKRAAA